MSGSTRRTDKSLLSTHRVIAKDRIIMKKSPIKGTHHFRPLKNSKYYN